MGGVFLRIQADHTARISHQATPLPLPLSQHGAMSATSTTSRKETSAKKPATSHNSSGKRLPHSAAAAQSVTARTMVVLQGIMSFANMLLRETY